jgi:hypothetical protein
MKQLLIPVLFAMMSQSVFAQFQETEYRGRDKNTNAPCKLYVTNAGYLTEDQSPESNFLDVVPRGFSHGGDSSGPFTLRPFSGNSQILYSHNGSDEMVLFFENGDFLSGSPSGYNIKWLHGNHYHYDVCRNMQKIE